MNKTTLRRKLGQELQKLSPPRIYPTKRFITPSVPLLPQEVLSDSTRIPQLKVKQVVRRKLSVAKAMGLYL